MISSFWTQHDVLTLHSHCRKAELYSIQKHVLSNLFEVKFELTKHILIVHELKTLFNQTTRIFTVESFWVTPVLVFQQIFSKWVSCNPTQMSAKQV